MAPVKDVPLMIVGCVFFLSGSGLCGLGAYVLSDGNPAGAAEVAFGALSLAFGAYLVHHAVVHDAYSLDSRAATATEVVTGEFVLYRPRVAAPRANETSVTILSDLSVRTS